MNFEELLEYLDIQDAAEFQYFETMADLLECDEYIEQEAVFELFRGADYDQIKGLLDDYFDDILNGLPDDTVEIYSLMDQIRMVLKGIISNAEDDSDLRTFTDEFYKFRDWYIEESEVELIPEDGGESVYQCVRDAITRSRMENLGGSRYRYNFDNALDYELDSYLMSFADLMADGYADDEDDID